MVETYFCHVCFQFYPILNNTENIVCCERCQSPIIELVQSTQQYEELDRLRHEHLNRLRHEQLNRMLQERELQTPLSPTVSVLLSNLHSLMLDSLGDSGIQGPISVEMRVNNIYGPQQNWTMFHSRPSVDDLMNTFVTFPNGVHDDERQVHPEAITDSPCIVCLNSINEDGESVVMLPCRHCFHSNCIKPWLQQNLECPMCRTSVV